MCGQAGTIQAADTNKPKLTRTYDLSARCDANNCFSSPCSSRFRRAVVAGPALVFTGFDKRTTQSIGGSGVRRNSSRVTRLTVLRVTARGASRFAATTPRRACGSALRRVYKTKCAVLYTGRKRKTDENSSVLTMRRSREKSWTLFWERSPSRSVTQATLLRPAGLSCQTLAAFGATCIEHSAATAGCHTGAEAVSTLTAHDGRLVSTFHVGLANQQK
jgi:hypothetical protein